jgi:hypothetical protein
MDLYKILDTLKVLEESAMQGFRDDGRKAAINKKPNENPFTKPGEEEMAKSWQAGYDSVTKPKTKNEGQRYPDTSTSLADREAVVPNIKDYDDKKINWDQTTRARKVEPTITPKTVTKKPMSPFGGNLKEEQQQCPECGGPMFSEMMINEKKDACYYKVKSRYKVWPSAYASGALVKCRKKGAKNWGSKSESAILEGVEQVEENIHQWFKDKWVRLGTDGKIKGPCARGSEKEGKPKCMPKKKAQATSKEVRANAVARKRREDPNPNRSGKAIMVPTKKRKNEDQLDELKCWPGYSRVPGTKEGTPGSCKRKTSEDNTMMSAAKKPTGPKFVGKMKGTDPASSRYNKLVGCEESVQEQIGREWAEYLNEFAPTQPGSQKTNNPVQQKAEADKEKGVKNLIQKTNTGTGAGINPGAAKDLVAAIDSPTANPKTGANMTQQAKSALNAIGAQHVQAASKNNMTATQKDVANLQNALGQK